jgi:predicted RNase H-like nuclease
MAWLAGIDGCRGGWVAALQDTGGGPVIALRFTTLADLLASPHRPAVAAIDMPIGLLDAGSRQCDQAARRLLPSRASGVFPAPIRPLLTAPSYAEANALSRALTGKGMTIESFNLVPKIRELDAVAQTAPPGLFRESWPELAFWGLKGAPLAHSKRTREGLVERRALLVSVFGPAQVASAEASRHRYALDDLYDALAPLQTGRHIQAGTALRVPEPPPVDACGLPMEIVYFAK